MAKAIVRAVFSASAVLGACLSITEPVGSCGSFVGRAGGESSDSLSGCAFFSIDQQSGAFGLVLTNGGPADNNPAVKLFRPAGRPPAPGTYTLSCGETNLCGVAVLGQRTFTLVGTVVVTTTDTLGLVGSIDVVGTDALQTTLTVRGDFTAHCKGQKSPFETPGNDRNDNTERGTPCKPASGAG